MGSTADRGTLEPRVEDEEEEERFMTKGKRKERIQL